MSQAVAQSLDLPQILNSALKKVAQLMAVDASYVYLGTNGHLVLEGYYGLRQQVAEQMKRIEINHGAISSIMERTELIIIRNMVDDGEPIFDPLAKGGYQSYVGIPLIMAGESIGVMGVATCFERHFTDREVELLTAIGREISIAVQNARLYEEASSARALRELEALRSELLANVSHELRTPLAAIKGFASSLLQPDVSFDQPTWHGFLQTIDKEADRLNRLIEELLVMSRLETGALTVKKQPHNLTEVIDLVRDRLDNLTSRHRLQIIIPRNLARLDVDEVRIGEVLTNLVENAVKYSEEGTVITVEAGPKSREVIVSVKDEGTGIPQELQLKVFDRFYQIDNTVASRKSGTGLGLCICHGIVEAHGGRIWLESEPGKGSKFSFSVPTA